MPEPLLQGFLYLNGLNLAAAEPFPVNAIFQSG